MSNDRVGEISNGVLCSVERSSGEREDATGGSLNPGRADRRCSGVALVVVDAVVVVVAAKCRGRAFWRSIRKRGARCA